MIQVTVENSKTGGQYICKSARRTVNNITYNHITYHLICRHKDHPFFKQFYHGPKKNRSPRKTYLEYTNIQITRANHYGNTPRRAYTIRKTVTRIKCGYIGGTYLLINQKKQYNYDTIYY